MKKSSVIFFALLWCGMVINFLSSSGFSTLVNHAPVVKILSPVNNSSYPWASQVPYSISVSDAEDGNSEYEEIAAKQVYLEVRYLADASKAQAILAQPVLKDPAGLAEIRSSNCANCHAFKTKLIGPSFHDICRRYSPTKTNIDLLTGRILKGTSGVWGNVKMPSHPELTKPQAEEMVNWILENAGDPDINFLTGTEGSFELTVPPGEKQNGLFILTASYLDHGTKDNPEKKLKGQDIIIVHGK